MVFKHLKNGGIIIKNQTTLDEKETICNQFKTDSAFGRSIKLLKNIKSAIKGIGKFHAFVVELLIIFQLQDEKVLVHAKDNSNMQAVLTAELITEVFGKTNTALRTYKCDMRYQEMNKLYDSLEELNNNPDSKFALRKVKALLRRESRFAAFKRNYIRLYQQKYPNLQQYIA